MFLNRFKCKQQLGRGTFGTVYLVEDVNNFKKLYALKEMTHKTIKQHSNILNYLDGEIQCMKEMNSPNIVNIYEDLQENNNAYLLLQYCDGGDLASYQKKQPNGVFTLPRAISILVEVLNGLEHLHNKKYIHRDIKPQNIFIKLEGQKEVFKIGDLSFSRKTQDIRSTQLGTLDYMSPQILQDKRNYGSQVDLWAFGVLFYKMLNDEYPFIDLVVKKSTEYEELRLQVKNFSYQKNTAAAKKKKDQISIDLKEQLQSFFEQIFQFDSSLRMTIPRIKVHSLFASYFPVAPKISLFYKQVTQPKTGNKIKNWAKFYEGRDYKEDKGIIIQKKTPLKMISKQYQKEQEILQRKAGEIYFLKLIYEDFKEKVDTIINKYLKMALQFNLLKYYMILLRNFKKTLSEKKLSVQYPGLKWNQYLKTIYFDNLLDQINENIKKNEFQYIKLYNECNQTNNHNQIFKRAMHKQITQTEFDGDFKESYRYTTTETFRVIRGQVGQILGNKLNYLMTICLIAHAFNRLFSDQASLKAIFKEYFVENNKKLEKIDYPELRRWMLMSHDESLKKIGKQIIKIYFDS